MVKKLRIEAGFVKQKDVEPIFAEKGIAGPTYRGIERGTWGSLKNLTIIADFYGCPIEYLIDETADPNAPAADASDSLYGIFAANLQTYMNRYGLNGLDVARRSGIPARTVWSVINAATSANVNTLYKICRGLRLDFTVMCTPNLPGDSIDNSLQLGKMLRRLAALDETDQDIIAGKLAEFEKLQNKRTSA